MKIASPISCHTSHMAILQGFQEIAAFYIQNGFNYHTVPKSNVIKGFMLLSRHKFATFGVIRYHILQFNRLPHAVIAVQAF